MPGWFERFLQDLRHALRLFAKSPGFTAICVLSIAFGTGANVAMFSVADALLLRPLPVSRPGELLRVGVPTRSGIFTNSVMSYADFADVRATSRSFESLAAYMLRRSGISIEPGAAPIVKVVNLVSANFFDVLAIRPAIGRGFLPEEERVPGRDAVAVISYGLWQQRYAGNPAVAGRTIRINAVDFTIVGVAPEGFDGLTQVGFSESVYVPLAMAPALGDEGIAALLTARDMRVLTVHGRLEPGVSLLEARAELEAAGADLARAYPETNREAASFMVRTEVEERFASNMLDVGLVLLLSILSTAVLAVACANVAGLLTSRAPLRAREMSLRLAIGAGRARLVRQLMTESLALSLVGGLCGLAVGQAGIILLRQMQYPTDLLQAPTIAIDQRALIFSLAVAVGSAFLFGIAPALQTTRIDLARAMRSADVDPRQRWRIGGRNSLVALQVALSLVLVTIAGYSLQMFHGVVTEGPGFRTSGIAKISVDTAHRRYTDTEAAAFFDRAAQAARALPQVTAASVSSTMSFWEVDYGMVAPEDSADVEDRARPSVLVGSVDEQYFDLMDMPILDGRPFAASDTPGSRRVAIVNDTFARRHWPRGAAVGKRLRVVGQDGWVEVVGVARTAKYLYIIEAPQEMVYFPFRQVPSRSMVLLTRTPGDSAALIAPMRGIMQTLDPDMPVYDAQTMETFYTARATGLVSVATQMIAGLGVMGVILTMVGLYGLVSYAAVRRTREIGIRMAIGATYAHVLRMMLGQGMRPAWLGLPIGVLLSVLTMRLLPTILQTDDRVHPLLIVVFVAIVLTVTVAAAFVPARRAARVNPMIALRYE